jgi:hypothetical protein
LTFKFGEKPPLPAVILHDDKHKRGDGKDGHPIGCPDENRVGAEIGHGGERLAQAIVARATCA